MKAQADAPVGGSRSSRREHFSVWRCISLAGKKIMYGCHKILVLAVIQSVQYYLGCISFLWCLWLFCTYQGIKRVCTSRRWLPYLGGGWQMFHHMNQGRGQRDKYPWSAPALRCALEEDEFLQKIGLILMF